MLKKAVITLSFLLAAIAAQAQSTPAKKELVARILKLQQPDIDAMARSLAEQPAAELMGSAANALPARVAQDKQDAVAKEIQGDIQKYLDEAIPLVQGRAVKLAPATVGALLEEKFTEDELKQVLSVIELPAYVKFQRLGGDMQKSLIDRLVADTRDTIEPKVRALEQTVGRRLGMTAGTQAPRPTSAGKAPAKPAAK